jgi:DNA-binding protein HU-beta
VNKAELMAAIAADCPDVPIRHIEAVVSAAISRIMATVATGDEVALMNFGTFKPKDRAERLGRNPKTGEPMTIPATVVPAFSPGKQFKEMVNHGTG